MKRLPIITVLLVTLLLAGCQVSIPSAGTGATDANSVESTQTEGQPDEQAESQPEEQSSQTKTVADVQAEEATAADNSPIDANAHPAELLISSFVEPSETNGEVLVLYGQVLDVNENPVPNSVVEIWQTDATGVYDHPQDPGTATRDTTFQFYGSASANADGWYVFRTIVPGRYEPRPRHIHYKVKQDDNTLLTSQFYFSDDIAEVQGEGMFQAVGDSGDLLLLQLVQGETTLLANGRIVVDLGIGSGTLPLTPSQGEGPYYPVADLAITDNDLVRLP